MALKLKCSIMKVKSEIYLVSDANFVKLLSFEFELRNQGNLVNCSDSQLNFDNLDK